MQLNPFTRVLAYVPRRKASSRFSDTEILRTRSSEVQSRKIFEEMHLSEWETQTLYSALYFQLTTK